MIQQAYEYASSSLWRHLIFFVLKITNRLDWNQNGRWWSRDQPQPVLPPTTSKAEDRDPGNEADLELAFHIQDVVIVISSVIYNLRWLTSQGII